MTRHRVDLGRSVGVDAKVRRMCFVLGPLLWGLGVVCSRAAGCGWDQAALKATVYAVSGLVGWGGYLLLRKPSPWSWWEFSLAWNSASLINLSLLQPTRTPWPFPAMMVHGAIVATVFMGIGALVVRWIKGRLRSAV